MTKSIPIFTCLAAILAVVVSPVSAVKAMQLEDIRTMNHVQSYEEQELKKDFAVMDESLAVIGNADKVLRVLARQNILLAFVKREKLIKVALGKFFQGGSDFNEACNLIYEAHVNGFQLVSNYFNSLLEQVKIHERAFGAVSISLDKCEQRLEARLREWHEKCSSN